MTLAPDAAAPAPGAALPPLPDAASPVQAGCPRIWLTRVAGRPRVPLLGLSAAAIRKCLGAPSRVGRSRLEYRSGLVLEVRHGRVQSIDLRDPSFRSDAGEVGVGSTPAALRRVLGPLMPDTRPYGYRAVTDQGRGRAGDVRVAVARGRVTRITAILRPWRPR
jgi:hypothetical protein